jgi:endonuclease/exonuclease/phosphatase family metal-dependent hydrolase
VLDGKIFNFFAPQMARNRDIAKYMTSEYASQLSRADFHQGAVSLDSAAASEVEMKVLVFNCGLLRLRGAISSGNWFENPPFADQRFGHLAEALLCSGADLIALTEIYEDAHVHSLIDQMKDKYPYHARGDVRNVLQRRYQWHNGLMILSKYPLEEHKIVKHKEAAPIEKMLGSKSMLVIRLVHKVFGRLCIVNMHTTAGDLQPEASDCKRESELQEAVSECEAAMAMGYKAIILGDLNMGPEASARNYNFLCQSGYVDAVTDCIGDQKGIVTWDPRNPLNAMGPHKASPPQRCDHVFVHRSSNVEAKSVHVAFSEANIDTPAGKCTLSDHYGILTSLRLRVEQTAKERLASISAASRRGWAAPPDLLSYLQRRLLPPILRH